MQYCRLTLGISAFSSQTRVGMAKYNNNDDITTTTTNNNNNKPAEAATTETLAKRG